MTPILEVAKEIAGQNKQFDFLVLGTSIRFESHEEFRRDWVGKISNLNLHPNSINLLN
jgi:hypothetical protein